MRLILIAVSIVVLFGCSANSSSVKTTTSPVDGKTTTKISRSTFDTSWIYPVSGSAGNPLLIDGGSVTDKQTASITVSTSSDSGYRSAYFKADGKRIDLTSSNAMTDFSSDQYGIDASTSFYISCIELKKVTQSKEVYLRVTFSDGFVDYDVSKPKYSGADGFGMIKKISQYCE